MLNDPTQSEWAASCVNYRKKVKWWYRTLGIVDDRCVQMVVGKNRYCVYEAPLSVRHVRWRVHLPLYRERTKERTHMLSKGASRDRIWLGGVGRSARPFDGWEVLIV